jgi:hypothetical protein
MNTIVQYFRQGGIKRLNNQKRRTIHGGIKKGIFVAFKDNNGKVRIGWTLCNTKAGDKFDDHVANLMAIGRAYVDDVPIFPPSMAKKATRFVERASKYFKDADLPMGIIPTQNFSTRVEAQKE